MEKLSTDIIVGLGTLAIIAIIAFVSGTIVYFIWPVAIPAAFPGLVASGALAAKLAWWQAVCLTWLFSILIKASQTNKKED